MSELKYLAEPVFLIKEIRNGRDDAYIIMMDMYNKQLAGYVWKKAMDFLSREDIADLIQDTWMDVYERIKNPEASRQYDPDRGSFPTYLFNIARFKILERMRQSFMTTSYDKKDGSEEDRPGIEALPDSAEYIPENTVINEARLRLKLKAYMELIRIIYLCGGYPHQQLAFSISKLLKGKGSNRALEGKLDIIYTKYSSISFFILNKNVRKLMMEDSSLEPKDMEQILEAFKPMEKRLELSLKELMSADKPSQSFYSAILGSKSGDTFFKEYYSISRDSASLKSSTQISNTISNWILKLEQRTRRILGFDTGDSCFDDYENLSFNKTACRDCKFKALPPCIERYNS